MTEMIKASKVQIYVTYFSKDSSELSWFTIQNITDKYKQMK